MTALDQLGQELHVGDIVSYQFKEHTRGQTDEITSINDSSPDATHATLHLKGGREIDSNSVELSYQARTLETPEPPPASELTKITPPPPGALDSSGAPAQAGRHKQEPKKEQPQKHQRAHGGSHLPYVKSSPTRQDKRAAGGSHKPKGVRK